MKRIKKKQEMDLSFVETALGFVWAVDVNSIDLHPGFLGILFDLTGGVSWISFDFINAGELPGLLNQYNHVPGIEDEGDQ